MYVCMYVCMYTNACTFEVSLLDVLDLGSDGGDLLGHFHHLV